MYKKIFIVTGHSDTDTGAVAIDGTTERFIVSSISNIIKNTVDSEKFEFIGLDESLDVAKKTMQINNICKNEDLDYKNSILVSLHADWRGAKEGVSGYYYRGYDPSKTLLEVLGRSVSNATNRNLLWMKPDTQSRFKRLGIVADTKPLACLLEVGSLRSDSDNSDGLELLKSPNGQKKIAMAIIKGIEDFIGERIPLKKDDRPYNDLSEIEFNSFMWEKLDKKEDPYIKDLQNILHERNVYLKASQ